MSLIFEQNSGKRNDFWTILILAVQRRHCSTAAMHRIVQKTFPSRCFFWQNQSNTQGDKKRKNNLLCMNVTHF